MTEFPLLSFIVLSYNYENYIGQTIRSILAQTVQDFEVVVVDDASKDTSREVVAAFIDPRIRLLVNERNLCGAEATIARFPPHAASGWSIWTPATGSPLRNPRCSWTRWPATRRWTSSAPMSCLWTRTATRIQSGR
jgi:hypothetical protein